MTVGSVGVGTTDLNAWAAGFYGKNSVHPTHGGHDNRIIVYGTKSQIEEAQNFLRPDMYRFVDVAKTGGVAPPTGGILLGDTRGDSGAGSGMRLAWTRIRPGLFTGNPHESLSKAVLDYAASFKFGGSTSGPGGLSNIYITGRVPPEHKVGPYGLPENFSAIGNGFRTPAQWLELRQQELAAAGFIPQARPAASSSEQEPAAGFGELLRQACACLNTSSGSDKTKAEGSIIPGELINDRLVECEQPAGASGSPAGAVNQTKPEQPPAGEEAAILPGQDHPYQQIAGTGSLALEAEARLLQAVYDRAVSIALFEPERETTVGT